MRKLLVSVLAAASTFALSAHASGVRLLGETVLAYHENDLDVMTVQGACRTPANPAVSKLKLRMTRASGEIEYVAVQYGNGVIDRLQVKEHFRQGGESRWIDLNFGARCVKKIYVIGDTDNGQSPRAQVEVYGYHP